MNKVALVIIFNHRYDQNIEVLRKIYKERFSNIYFLVPFYNGNAENVIPVYESSFYFQGFVAQGFRHYFKEDYDHYFFVADDMVVNPIITENNYKEIFSLDNESGFIPELEDIPENWPHNRSTITYNPYGPGTEIRTEIPAVEEAISIISKAKKKVPHYNYRKVYFYSGYPGWKSAIKQFVTILYDKLIVGANLKTLKYPVVYSYSDIFIVSAKSIKKFIHYCGVFASTNLWVELAIPTALVLSGEKIQFQKSLKLQGKPLWTTEDYKELEPYDFQLKKLMSNFPPNYIYLHPIKLSKWNTDL